MVEVEPVLLSLSVISIACCLPISWATKPVRHVCPKNDCEGPAFLSAIHAVESRLSHQIDRLKGIKPLPVKQMTKPKRQTR